MSESEERFLVNNILMFGLSGGYIVKFTPHFLHILCVRNTLMNVSGIKIYSTYVDPV